MISTIIVFSRTRSSLRFWLPNWKSLYVVKVLALFFVLFTLVRNNLISDVMPLELGHTHARFLFTGHLSLRLVVSINAPFLLHAQVWSRVHLWDAHPVPYRCMTAASWLILVNHWSLQEIGGRHEGAHIVVQLVQKGVVQNATPIHFVRFFATVVVHLLPFLEKLLSCLLLDVKLILKL